LKKLFRDANVRFWHKADIAMRSMMRVSTDKQTVENQIRELRQIAERRGWEVVEDGDDLMAATR
jgi:SepF-like predicted cell division protein (DUF552 family)